MNSRPSAARTIGKYLSELLVIILGITLSFVFDEWRQGRQDRRSEREILHNLRTNLAEDTLLIRNCLLANAQMMRGIDSLLRIRNLAATDSTPYYVDLACSYVPWMPSTSAFAEAKQTGTVGLLRDDTLRGSLFGFYDKVYGGVVEWQTIDRKQVLDVVIPAVNQAVPLSTDSSVRPLHAARGQMLKEARIQNNLRTGRVYKEALQSALRMALAYARAMHHRTDGLLQKGG